ncbi:MAG TPA: metallophosphoesterase [Chloroflexota bacterium]|nr:metallophosphoesterase [Chloroflexota bacterium]
MSRNSLLAALAAAGAASLWLYARQIEPAWLERTELELTLEHWPAELDGLRLVLVADVHLGRVRGRVWTSPALESAVRAIDAAQADILIVAGDFGFKDWDPSALVEQVDQMRAPVRIAVLGNHDYAGGEARACRLAEELKSAGFHVLRNQVVRLEVRGRPVWIAGLDDGASGRAEMGPVVDQLSDETRPVILVSHKPDTVRLAPEGVFDLALSGHTHGGQIALPLLNPLMLRRTARTRFDRGLYRINGIPTFVTRGLGMVGRHARFLSRPEVAVLRLRSAPGTE